MEYFTDSAMLSTDFINRFYTSIYEHGVFIYGHLEQGPPKTNHYLSDIAGLLLVAVYCPFLEESKEWQQFCVRELEMEMQHQVYEDGCSFEGSTAYHRLSLELFFYSALVARRAGITFASTYQQRLRKMFDVSLHCIKPDGMMPQIGDNDNGRFLMFSQRPIQEHRYLLSLAAIFFNDADFKLKSFQYDEEALWVFGDKGHNIWQSLAENCLADIKSRSYADAGWYLMRNNNDYCLISCGWNGGNGVHSHNDKLSFELTVNGHDIIVDPGTYVYTSYPRERNKFRSTEYHNTLKLDGYEQNDIPDKNMFCLPDKVRIICTELVDHDGRISFYGEISYKDVTHKRVIILDKKDSDWQIVDNFSCSKQVKAQLRFHLSPYVITDGNVLLTKAGFEKVASIEVRGLEMKKEPYDNSPEYGVRQMAECLFADVSAMGTKQKIVTHIRSAR